MARRLALLALLACVLAARRPPASYDDSYYDSGDSYSFWDDYDDETTPPPRIRSTTTSAKVILRGKVPKVNVTVKATKGDDKKVIKTTNINIESHTNFIVTKAPIANHETETKRPVIQINEDYVVVESPDVESQQFVASTKKPVTSRRPSSNNRLPTKRPSTTRRPVRRTVKTTKPSKNKKPCPTNNSGWLSSFFQDKKQKKNPKKPAKSGWLLVPGIFSNIYNWFMNKKSSWFGGGGGWFQDSVKAKIPNYIPPTTTTPEPLTPAPSWFHNLVESEENDGAYATELNAGKKATKKSLKKTYRGYQLLRTYPDVKWKVQEMLDLQEEAQGSGIMWWTPPSLNGTTDLVVPPDLLEDVKEQLKSSQIEYDVVIWDLQKAIAYENPRLSKKQRIELEQVRGHPMTWRRYHRYADILRYLEYLQHSHSDVVELIPLGRSSEGLPLVAVKISIPSNENQIKESGNKGNKKKWKLRSRMKPAVWIDGGAHAREWIAPAVATWIIHTLVEGEKGLGADLEVLKQADFYIMPVLNPDGYEHSHTHDRLWSKTRSRSPDHSDDYFVGWFPWNWGQIECVGVDADRNWDYQWGEQDSSSDPCSDNYAGPHPFSESETRAVSEFLTEHRGQIKVFISLHAYTQAWLVPSFQAHAPFADDGIVMEMGKLATSALSDLFGTKYQLGTVADLHQPASGMSHDWAKARAGIKFSYHVDLRDSFGPYGFLLPGSQIVSTARETWQAVKAIVDNLTP